MNDNLQHHGVKGMKWGKRKDKYVTVFQSQRNALSAAEKARRKVIDDSREAGIKGIGSFRKVNREVLNAKRKAYGESIKADRNYNAQLRAKRKSAIKRVATDSVSSIKTAYSTTYKAGKRLFEEIFAIDSDGTNND